MTAPEPLLIPGHGRILRVRHDDPHLAPLTDQGKRLAAAVTLASDVAGLRLVLPFAAGNVLAGQTAVISYGRW